MSRLHVINGISNNIWTEKSGQPVDKNNNTVLHSIYLII